MFKFSYWFILGTSVLSGDVNAALMSKITILDARVKQSITIYGLNTTDFRSICDRIYPILSFKIRRHTLR